MKQFEDRLGKFLVQSLFGDVVRLEVGADLLPNTFYADILMIPDEPLPQDIAGAGLLSRLTNDARCLVEPFSGAVPAVRLEGNVVKLRLALYRAYDDKMGTKSPDGVLWIIAAYWPQKAIQRVFGEEGEEVEPGLRRWKLSKRETIYMVNTSVIELREETILFRLLGRGGHRKEIVIKIFKEQMEPYITILNNFDLRFKKMVQTEEFQHIDPEELKNLIELRDTRMEVLLEQGLEQGIEQGIEQGTKKTLQKTLLRQTRRKFGQLPSGLVEKIAALPIPQLEQLLDDLFDLEDISALESALSSGH